MEQDRGNGFEVRLAEVVFSVSAALDLVSPVVVGHHRRVARIARAIATQLGLPEAESRNILLAASLHDIGAFALKERVEIMRFETDSCSEHSGSGFRLLRAFPGFEEAAEIVRFHHLPWAGGRGESWRGAPVPMGSHLLHLADRVSVLRVEGGDGAPGLTALAAVAAGSGGRFVPDFVRALTEASAAPGFWRQVGRPGDDDLRADPLFRSAVLSDADFRGLARMFWQIVDFRSRFTATHTSGVAAVAGFLAPLAGVGGAAARRVAVAAGLHDLGKLAVPSEILEKERPLAKEERTALRDHPTCGWRILERVQGMEEINRWANLHHERLDGSGYPFGLSAGEIPHESRLVAVADVFTALTEERPYRRGLSPREAIDILGDMAVGGALDHDLVGVLGRNREGAAYVRRLAQEHASEHYLEFLGQAPEALCQQHSAA